MGQTFLSASWGDFPVAPKPDWKVRRTGRLESLPHVDWRGIVGLNFGIQVEPDFLDGFMLLPHNEVVPRSACFSLSALPIQASDPLFVPSIHVNLGPEQIVAPGAGWPYLFQSSEGTTVVLRHVKWIPKCPYPIHFTVRSFDERKTWEPWTPSPEQGVGADD